MLCDDTTANDLDGIVPIYLSDGVATAALRFLLTGGDYFPHTKLCNRSEPAKPRYRELFIGVDAAIEAPSAQHRGAPMIRAGEPDGRRERTARQADVLEALDCGCSNKVIARELDILEATVKIHARQPLRKFDASTARRSSSAPPLGRRNGPAGRKPATRRPVLPEGLARGHIGWRWRTGIALGRGGPATDAVNGATFERPRAARRTSRRWSSHRSAYRMLLDLQAWIERVLPGGLHLLLMGRGHAAG